MRIKIIKNPGILNEIKYIALKNLMIEVMKSLGYKEFEFLVDDKIEIYNKNSMNTFKLKDDKNFDILFSIGILKVENAKFSILFDYELDDSDESKDLKNFNYIFGRKNEKLMNYDPNIYPRFKDVESNLISQLSEFFKVKKNFNSTLINLIDSDYEDLEFNSKLILSIIKKSEIKNLTVRVNNSRSRIFYDYLISNLDNNYNIQAILIKEDDPFDFLDKFLSFESYISSGKNYLELLGSYSNKLYLNSIYQDEKPCYQNYKENLIEIFNKYKLGNYRR